MEAPYHEDIISEQLNADGFLLFLKALRKNMQKTWCIDILT